MAALKHDAQGFLQGDPVQFGELLSTSRDMAGDIRAIRGHLEGSAGRSRSAVGVASPKAQSEAVSLSAVAGAVSKAANDAQKRAGRMSGGAGLPSGGGSGGRAATASPNGSNGTAAAVITKAATQAAVSAAAQSLQSQRDSRGRFAKGSAKGGGAGGGAGGDESESSSGGGVASRLFEALKEAGNAEEADPAIKAFNEVAKPMARGWEILGGDKKEKKQERWYRRFWQHMRRDKEDQDRNDKLTQKGIKALIEKPTGNKPDKSFMGVLLSGLGALLASIFGRFLPKGLMGAAGGLGGLGGAAGASAGAGKAGGKAGGRFGGLKGGLKRIPLLGSALTLLGGAGAVWDSESSDMSRAEKDKATGSAVGGTAGTLGGMAAGAKLGAMAGALGGPIGMAIGTLVGGAAGAFFGDKAGQVLGEKVGGFVSYLREADIPGKFQAGVDFMSAGFSKTMSALSAGWDAGVSFLKDLAGGASEWASKKIDSANEAVRNATGIDIKAGAQVAIQAAKDTAQKAGEAVSEAATKAAGLAKKAATATGDAVSSAASATGNALKNTTVGKGVTAVATAASNAWKASDRKKAIMAEMDSQGITDQNERAMLLAQVDHESNGFRAGEESFNYRSADRIMAVSKTAAKKGKPAIEAAMKQGPEAIAELMYGGRMGNKDAGDGFKFRGRGNLQITGRDNYKALGAKLGLDLENNPDLLNDPAIAAKASVQWWKDSGAGAKARAGDVKATTQVVNGGQNGIDHRTELFAQYKKDPSAVYAGAPVGVAAAPAVSGAVSAHAPVVSTGAVSAAQSTKLAEAPAVPKAIVSGGGRGSVNPPMADPGQDLGDRRLAHVATGGIGGAA